MIHLCWVYKRDTIYFLLGSKSSYKTMYRNSILMIDNMQTLIQQRVLDHLKKF